VHGSVLWNAWYSPNQSHWPFEQVRSLVEHLFSEVRKAWRFGYLSRRRLVRISVSGIGRKESDQVRRGKTSGVRYCVTNGRTGAGRES